MKLPLLIASFVLLTVASGNLHAKPGKIVKGENGTKWCCPNGKKGDGCEKGASSTPVGARCNFASQHAVPNPRIQPTNTDALNANPQVDKPEIKENLPTPD